MRIVRKAKKVRTLKFTNKNVGVDVERRYVLSKSEDKRDLVTNKNDILEQSQLFYTI